MHLFTNDYSVAGGEESPPERTAECGMTHGAARLRRRPRPGKARRSTIAQPAPPWRKKPNGRGPGAASGALFIMARPHRAKDGRGGLHRPQ